VTTVKSNEKLNLSSVFKVEGLAFLVSPHWTPKNNGGFTGVRGRRCLPPDGCHVHFLVDAFFQLVFIYLCCRFARAIAVEAVSELSYESTLDLLRITRRHTRTSGCQRERQRGTARLRKPTQSNFHG
jgi:hypothetical protein